MMDLLIKSGQLFLVQRTTSEVEGKNPKLPWEPVRSNVSWEDRRLNTGKAMTIVYVNNVMNLCERGLNTRTCVL